MFNPIGARILFLFQLVMFIAGVSGMVVLLHTIEDPAQSQQRLDARMDAMP